MTTKASKKPATQATKSKTSSATRSGAKPSTKAADKTKTSTAASGAAKGGAKATAKTLPSRSVKAPTPKPKPAPPPAPEYQPTAAASTPLRPSSKQSQLLGLLQSQGATIAQMSELTGWQPHTIRATMSAVFRKRLGLTIEASKADGSSQRMYRITSQATA